MSTPNDLRNNIIAVRSMSEIPATLREQLVVLGLARVVAYSAAVPASPVDNPVAFFNEASKEGKVLLSAVNENTVVNLSKVLDMAGIIYRARYDMVHAPASKSAQQLVQQALVAAGDYNFPQSIADALQQSEDSTDLGRSIGFALNMFVVSDLASAAQVVEETTEE